MQAPGQVQWGSGESSGEGLGGFGAEPGQVQQGSREGSGLGQKALVQSQVRFNRVPEKVPEKVRLWCRARSGTGFRRRFRRRFPRRYGRLWCRDRSGSGESSGESLGGFGEALVQSQVRFNRVPENVPEKVGGAGAFPEKVWDYGAEPGQVQQGSGKGEGLGGFGAEPGQVQQGSGEGSGEGLWGLGADPAAVFAARGFASERFVKIKRCGCWGYHRSLFANGAKKTSHLCWVSRLCRTSRRSPNPTLWQGPGDLWLLLGIHMKRKQQLQNAATLWLRSLSQTTT